jgi:hypothetical protein
MKLADIDAVLLAWGLSSTAAPSGLVAEHEATLPF